MILQGSVNKTSEKGHLFVISKWTWLQRS